MVTHPDRADTGTVIDSAGPAWTPDALTATPPDADMVKVRWSDSADPMQIYWEYASELRATEVPLNVEPFDEPRRR
ncbi:hypothetical protein AWC17_03185 [Mycobacterium nebraskense]|uniref:Uncharacterized protein n=1 Tax=Mycobacterium nebraskense TaxID=244292 RepID=A0A1X1ZMI2_9MYCO|nr:hypothetical protein AWC17_03185 [Mycobacterium nebraskense]